ncbi:MAG: NAD(P)/FAD-dependent oxidoreductase [Actinobacteria bacterium]|nr:NAD(P)/FAD-dependent oxidoreductase [Actinomycetota bacterium]
MPAESYDLIVLGAGSGARDGAQKAAREFGASVALVESTRWGGSCPNVACKPTKAYVVAAELLHEINSLAGVLGIEVGPARANLAKIKARKDELVAPQESWIKRLGDAGFTTVDGTAAFVDPRTVRVGDRELSAERIMIATGSRTATPPIEGLTDAGWVDHVSALELTEVPESLLVVGGGPVGLELAQVFSRFGSRVTLVQGAARITPRSDADASDELAASLADEGIEILTETRVGRVTAQDGSIVATLTSPNGGSPGQRRIAQILLASGRHPNVEELELDRVGVEQTPRGITVDQRLRTTTEGIWAAGDVTGLAQFTPIAQYQARIAIDDMFGRNGSAADYSLLPTAIFTEPELAGIGLTEGQAREQGLAVGVVKHPVSSVQRAAYTNTRRGLYKIVFDRQSRRVLGVHAVCPNASDVIQGLTVALRLRATVDDLAHAHHAFPTFGEGLKAAAEQA